MIWASVPLFDAFTDESSGHAKIPQNHFAASGRFPIVDQGHTEIAGYTDDDAALCRVVGPVIIFGDHTRHLKFVDFRFAIGADGVKVLKPRDGWEPRFLFHALRRANVPAAGYSRHFKFLKEVRLPKPSLDEQRRIAALLDQADALRAKRRRVLAHLETLTQSIFHDTFAMTGDEGEAPLAEFAEVTSGITKGRRTSEATSLVPYLAVSNVQAGHLKMDVVKEIEATAAEIDRYALRDGDLILTEGGDPDKLGRGTVWRSELPLCLHQNHIFRVRVVHGSAVLPDYLAAYLASRRARAYFLRSAKQTTGIASINMTQLKSLPVVVPRMNDQAAFVSRMAVVSDRVASAQHALAANEELFASLQSRAFSGEL